MTNDEIRTALESSDKASRKALARLALEIEADQPERYKAILNKTDWTDEGERIYRRYRRACVLSRVAMIIACLVVIAAYLVGDFGMRLFTGWVGRSALSIGILLAMGFFAGGALLLNSCKERLIAYGILEGL
ncbi:MAG: hypothetical protein J6K89_02920 [Oscillospiraceae bacterium]|nr:hypothetical protein [Oscillospiraceae bacterium]